MTQTGTVCLVCESTSLSSVLDVPAVPVHCNSLYGGMDEALKAPSARLDLVECRHCGHIFNRAFDAGLLHYGPGYENSLHFSAHFQGYARDLAKRLISRYALRDKRVMEIGCGTGDLLKLLCEEGPNHGVGFDPSYQGPLFRDFGLGARFIRDFYSEAYAREAVDLVCCRHVLEHLPNPASLLRSLHAALEGQPHATVYFEVPNGAYTFDEMGIWDLIYEHHSYFSRTSLESLFERNGFATLNSGSSFHGQFLWIECSRRDRGGRAT